MRTISLSLLALTTALLAQDPYGTGSPAQSGVTPRLSSNQPFMGHLAFALALDRGAGGGSALVALSFGTATPAPGPFPICIDLFPSSVILTLESTLSGTPGVAQTGTAVFPIPLAFPPSVAIAGLRVYAQAAVIDPFVPGGDLALTNCLDLELGYPPLVFVGTSVAGANDLYAFVDPLSGGVTGPVSGAGFTNNVDGAAFAHGGLDLFIAASLGPRISRIDYRGASPTLNTHYEAAAGSLLFEVGHDRNFDRLYTLVGSSASNRELIALNANPASGSPVSPLGSTTGLTGGAIAERWALSRTGRVAAVPLYVISAGPLLLVDTIPTSPTYLQATATSIIPGTSGILGAAVSTSFSPDDETCWVGLSGVGLSAIARYHLPSQSWIDHDLLTGAIDNITLPGLFPRRVVLSRDGSFAVACGSGWIARIDLDRNVLSQATVTSYPISAALLNTADGLSISPDGAQVAVTSVSPPKLLILDAQPMGAILQNIALPGMSNLTTTTWR